MCQTHKYYNIGFGMPRLSLWKDGKHSNDYKFIDRRISEMFTIGGTGIHIHKYLGTVAQGTNKATSAAQVSAGFNLTFPNTTGINIDDFAFGPGIPSGTRVASKTSTTVTLNTITTSALASGTNIGFGPDATKPSYANQSEQNIQDLLFLENRDRKYDTDIYKMRGIYQRQDQDFDLSQFGLFLQTGTIFMVFHLRDMVDTIGRKLMAGDVLELEHLKDYDALNQDVPAALKRYYVVGDCSFASEGFSPTWWPHLWRVKLNPLVDSQEYKDILNNITAGDNTTTPLGELLSTYNAQIAINDAVIAQAEAGVPKSGYNTQPIYLKPFTENGTEGAVDSDTADETNVTADTIGETADEAPLSPRSKIQGYLTGDGLGPNGLPVGLGIEFPSQPAVGDYFLRSDYLPNRLFRFDGRRWVKIEDVQRTSLTPGPNNKTLRSGFVNDTTTYLDSEGEARNTLQSLSKAFTPRADN